VRESDFVAVDTNNGHRGESLKNRFGVTAETQCSVDDDRTVTSECRSKSVETLVEQYGDVSGVFHVVPVESDVPIPVRYLPWGKYFRGGRESQHH
jgi:hypothetical protein